MINTELHAAGIDDEKLRESYRYCRRLNAEHGRTYFLATRLLTPSQRPAVHALYGFARYADDILDDMNSEATVAEREARLERLAQWYEKDWPSAAASLREGLDETFTINDIGLPGRLRRCLATTNLIESPGAGVRLRTRRV